MTLRWPAMVVALSIGSTIPMFAQTVVVRDGQERRSAAIIREVTARPHVLRSGGAAGGAQALEFPRDSTITSSLLVIGRPTYIASRVEGDVVVVGSDLFLRPGVHITGRAIAIGGTVALTTLGHVAGGVESIRDDTYLAVADGNRLLLDYRDLRLGSETPMFQLAGIQGFHIPRYDRVNGLSVPVAGLITLGERAVELEPTLTYRSRLGVVDPSVEIRLQPGRRRYFEGRVGIDTRTNDGWIRSDLVNSATSFLTGSDTRNYFRSRGGEGRAYMQLESPGRTLNPFVGARYERVTPITAVGNVYTVTRRKDLEYGSRQNVLVEPGNIGSALLGADLFDTSGVVTTRLRAQAEQSFTTPASTGRFLQFTLDGRVNFPTFSTQRLLLRAHGVATSGDSVPKARYVNLGGSGTLPLLDLFEQGGSQLLFLESRYLIPIDRIVLPYVGTPVITVRHFLGAAGVGSLPRLEQEVGVGVGVSFFNFDFTTDAGGNRGSKFGVGISLSR